MASTGDRSGVNQKIRAVEDAAKKHHTLAMSLAPSFPAHFEEHLWPLLAGAVKSLGFSVVEPTTCVLPELIPQRAEALAEDGGSAVHISRCCPRVLSLVQLEFPNLAGRISPVLSPATYHARYLREKMGERSFVVFAGPCPDKEVESRRPENTGAPDLVLTFNDLAGWLSETGAWDKALDAPFSHEPPAWTYLSLLVMDADGMRPCRRMLQRAGDLPPGYYELLACHGGCLGGSGISPLISLQERRERILKYAGTKHAEQPMGGVSARPLSRHYAP